MTKDKMARRRGRLGWEKERAGGGQMWVIRTGRYRSKPLIPVTPSPIVMHNITADKT